MIIQTKDLSLVVDLKMDVLEISTVFLLDSSKFIISFSLRNDDPTFSAVQLSQQLCLVPYKDDILLLWHLDIMEQVIVSWLRKGEAIKEGLDRVEIFNKEVICLVLEDIIDKLLVVVLDD